MATYYVRKSGSDANAGTSAGAAWLTIGKALGAAGMASGDTVYVGAGVYRETVSLGLTNPTAETFVIGDVDGVQTGDAGEVVLSGYTTNDTTAPSATTLLSINTRDFMTFRRILFIGGNATMIAASAGSSNVKFEDCAMIVGDLGDGSVFSITVAAGANAAWTIDRCFMLSGGGNSIVVTLNRDVALDYNAGILVRNCVILARANALRIASTGTGIGLGGGVSMVACSVYGGNVQTADANLSTSIPCTVLDSVIYCDSAVALTATTSGQITEDFNLLVTRSPRTNVTAGTNSKSDGSYAPLVEFGQHLMQGRMARPFMEPCVGSPLLGFGTDGSTPAVDARNGRRPAGGASATKGIGALERANSAVKETGTVRTGSNAIAFTGPGYHDFLLPVDALSTTVTVYGRFDATYAGSKPAMQVVNGTEAGVADATATMVGASGAWEQLSLQFTPTVKGVVTIRLLSQDTNGGGKAFFDDFAVA